MPRPPVVRGRRPGALLAWMVSAVALAGCTTAPATSSLRAPHGAPPTAFDTPRAAPAPVTSLGFDALRGWAEEDHAAALEAFAAGCTVSRDPDLRPICARARKLGRVPDGAARQFFEFNFRLAPLPDVGVLTAYFAPEYEARTAAEGRFVAPLRPPPRVGSSPARAAPELDPSDLLRDDAPATAQTNAPPATASGQMDRASLAQTPAPDALAWMRPEDLFFLQIQGSGVLDFPDGRRMKAVYAGDNGLAFVAIARPMVRQGWLAPDRVSGETIRAWLAAHAGRVADAVMNLDPRYVFFALEPDDGRDPRGAAGVSLTPGRALAVDPSRHGFGDLYWVDAEGPVLSGAVRRYRRLALALDTGSAIRGAVRADLYVGRGGAAGEEAGRVRHALRLVRLVPVASAMGDAP